jgi:hypothetical protein
MSRVAFTLAMQSMPAFRSVMDAYIQAFLEQVMVSVACNGAHSLKQRLARWLLMMRDRNDGDARSLSLRACLPKCWVSKGRPSRMPPESSNVQV